MENQKNPPEIQAATNPIEVQAREQVEPVQSVQKQEKPKGRTYEL